MKADDIQLELLTDSEQHCVFKRIYRPDVPPLILIVYNFGQKVSGLKIEKELCSKFLSYSVYEFLKCMFDHKELEAIMDTDGWTHAGLISKCDPLDVTDCRFFMIDQNGNPIYEEAFIQRLLDQDVFIKI